MALNPEDARPLNVQLAECLRKRITGGEFPAGQKIPSLRALAKEYSVAELTVHTAVRDLQREGILVSTAGRGTFVREVPASEAEHTDDELLTELRAIRAELEDLREKVLGREATAIESRLEELARRMDIIESGGEPPAAQQ
ncbi:GntR family transcriptional regulator [Crossiella sp. CA198]|uniref:GntR family transcriptional regulator n=1 Tax=Crossiella sp. CA198 TaxID=3455607 RepID=UPI003F8D553B